jgi:hypothetical protein
MPFLPTDNLAYPVLISVAGKTGSGFFYNSDDAVNLVTARHVLFKNHVELYEEPITLTCSDRDLSQTITITLDGRRLFAEGDLRKSDKADVAICKIAIPSAKLACDMRTRGIRLSSRWIAFLNCCDQLVRRMPRSDV